jgi:hypothetical protein
MKYPTKPFDVPVQVADLDMLVTVKITDYIPARPDGWFDPVTGIGEPPDDGSLEFDITTIRRDGRDGPCVRLEAEIAELFADSEELRQACLDAIERHNERPED